MVDARYFNFLVLTFLLSMAVQVLTVAIIVQLAEDGKITQDGKMNDDKADSGDDSTSSSSEESNGDDDDGPSRDQVAAFYGTQAVIVAMMYLGLMQLQSKTVPLLYVCVCVCV